MLLRIKKTLPFIPQLLINILLRDLSSCKCKYGVSFSKFTLTIQINIFSGSQAAFQVLLVLCQFLANPQKFNNLRQHVFKSCLWNSTSQTGRLELKFSDPNLWGLNHIVNWLACYMEALGRNSLLPGCRFLAKPSPCGFRTEVTISLPASARSYSRPPNCATLFSMWFFLSRSQHWFNGSLSVLQISLTHFSATTCRKCCYDYRGLPRLTILPKVSSTMWP